jgi:hypothetical protein
MYSLLLVSGLAFCLIGADPWFEEWGHPHFLPG